MTPSYSDIPWSVATPIIGLFLAQFLAGRVAEVWSMVRLTSVVPPEMVDMVDTQLQNDNRRYNKLKLRLRFAHVEKYKAASWAVGGVLTGCAQDTTMYVGVMVMWLGGWFGYLDHMLRAFSPHVPVVIGLAYIFVAVNARVFMSLPFAVYDQLVIEEKFGFNQHTPLSYLVDLAKGMAITFTLLTPVTTGVLLFFQYCGRLAWLYSFLLTSLFFVVVYLFGPAFILPLFFKVRPLPSGPLLSAIEGLLLQLQFPITAVQVMAASSKSTHTRAFFLGLGASKRLVLYDTLVDTHTTPELLALIAREVGHHKKGHVVINGFLGVANFFLTFLLLSLCVESPRLTHAFLVAEESVYTSAVLFFILYSPLGWCVWVLANTWARRTEYECDRYAVQVTGHSGALCSALKKMAVHNHSNLTPATLDVWLNYQAPPVVKRIRKINTWGDWKRLAGMIRRGSAEVVAAHGEAELPTLRELKHRSLQPGKKGAPLLEFKEMLVASTPPRSPEQNALGPGAAHTLQSLEPLELGQDPRDAEGGGGLRGV